jgi:hypothetical protein
MGHPTLVAGEEFEMFIALLTFRRQVGSSG